MPIITPSVNTNIETPIPAGSIADVGLASLLQGMRGDQAQSLQKQQADSELKNLLAHAQAQGDQERQNITAKGEQEQKNAAAQDQLERSGYDYVKSTAPDGSQIHSGKYSSGVDPTIALHKQQLTDQSKALDKVNSDYTKAIPKLQDQAAALEEYKGALANPNQMTIGTVKSLALKAMGMNRYNKDEANAVLPPSVQGIAANIMNMGGGNESPLNPQQLNDATNFGAMMVKSLEQKHNIIKANALNGYMMNPRHDQDAASALQNQMGAPLSNQIGDLTQGYSDLAQKYQAQAAKPAPLPTVAGAGSSLINLLTGGSKAAPLTPQQAAQAELLKRQQAPAQQPANSE
jgi:hypothetical protein